MGEAITRWDGWSLSVPPVGSALNEPTIDEDEIHDKSKPGAAEKGSGKIQSSAFCRFQTQCKSIH